MQHHSVVTTFKVYALDFDFLKSEGTSLLRSSIHGEQEGGRLALALRACIFGSIIPLMVKENI
jgi:hypothetical protein